MERNVHGENYQIIIGHIAQVIVQPLKLIFPDLSLIASKFIVLLTKIFYIIQHDEVCLSILKGIIVRSKIAFEGFHGQFIIRHIIILIMIAGNMIEGNSDLGIDIEVIIIQGKIIINNVP